MEEPFVLMGIMFAIDGILHLMAQNVQNRRLLKELFSFNRLKILTIPAILKATVNRFLIKVTYVWAQWRSQPANLVPLGKFTTIIIIHFFRNLLFSRSVNCKYLHSGTKSSGWLRYCVGFWIRLTYSEKSVHN